MHLKDPRARVARYYDLIPNALNAPEDLGFYRRRLPSPKASVLELGCGTGRVLVPLARSCGYIHGVDFSPASVSICRRRLSEAGIPKARATVELGNITSLDLDRRFDLITAPWRVLQNLETDAEVDALFAVIRRHLTPEGRCVLNVFKPYTDRETLRRQWCQPDETFCREAQMGDHRVRLYERRPSMDRDKMIIYPELIFREYDDTEMVDEAVLKICMRCYYPNEFEELVTGHDFEVVGRWGGYKEETYGEGPELLIEFKHRTRY